MSAVDPAGIQAALDRWAAAGTVPALAAGRADLWGPQAQPEAAQRLGWLTLPETSAADLPRWQAVADATVSPRRVVLAGMGGSSLGAEVVARTAGVEVTVVDTTDPSTVRRRLLADPAGTVLVVGSKSGSTVETDAHRRAFTAAIAEALPPADRAGRIIVVTDPGSALEATANEAGHPVIHGVPEVGGRFSVLSAFGLLAPLLAGADVEPLLAAAATVQATLADPTGPAAVLGAVLASCAAGGSGRVVLPPGAIPGFPDWAEQLIAESTGKGGRGLLPVVVGAGPAPTGPAVVTAGGSAAAVVAGGDAATVVEGAAGAQFLLWEFATALAGEALGINPFDQPDVQRSKAITAGLLEQRRPIDPDGTATGAVRVVGGTGTPVDAIRALLRQIAGRAGGSGGYLGVLAYLDPDLDAALAAVRDRLQAGRRETAVTFGWGPRYLHSTGQLHKGGRAEGGFLLVTGEPRDDLPVPGTGYGFADLQRAQALGDAEALRSVGAPVVHLHLADREAGVAELLEAAASV